MLPDSCSASADILEKDRKVYEQKGVFDPRLIDGILGDLRKFNDRTLRADINADPKTANEKTLELVQSFIQCG